MSVPPVYVRPLSDVGRADVAAAGGKAASLGELARAGIPVPRGYVVTAAAFARAMAVVGGADALVRSVENLAPEDSESVGRVAAELRALITAVPVPVPVASAVLAAYGELCGAGAAGAAGAVAVRSSATLEDSAEASFAGLQDTYLGVRGADGVLDAVRRCWASLYNDESVVYRRRMGLPERGLAMAVVVQRMLRPRAAGVMFTRSPVSGDRSVVAIEGTWGLGSALVAGEVTPDAFTVSKVTGEITGRRVGTKLRLHSLLPNGPGISVTVTPIALRGRACLSDDEARALAAVARRVEEHYGAPQDIEWALLGDDRDHPALHCDTEDRIMLLQSRPETVW
ncbi:MAG: PEP/pyruvate-binding domain-containing protein, partial [Streptosporangiaceae bacterium]